MIELRITLETCDRCAQERWVPAFARVKKGPLNLVEAAGLKSNFF